MKRAIKIVSIVFVGLIALAVAGVAVLSSLDFNEYKGEVAAQVREATGRELVIEGDLDLKISLSPALKVEGVRFANAEWAAEKDMMSVDLLEAEVNILPLLNGQVDVTRVLLKGVTLDLQKNAEGQANWAFGPADPADPASAGTATEGAAASPSDAPALPLVRDVVLEDLSLRYRDAAGGHDIDLNLAEVRLGADGATSPLSLKVSGAVNGEGFSLDGTLGTLESLSTDLSSPVDMTMAIADIQATAKGVIGPLSNVLDPLDIRATVAIDSLGKSAARLIPLLPEGVRAPLPDMAPFAGTSVTADVRAAGKAGGMSLSAFKVSVAGDPVGQVKLEGSVEDVLLPAGLKAAVSAKLPDVAALAAAAGATAPSLPEINLSADVGQDLPSLETWKVADLDLSVGETRVMGEVTAALSGQRPQITANLSSPLIDVDALLPAPEGDGEGEGAAPAPAAGSTGSGIPGPDGEKRVLPDDPLPAELLQLVDADVAVDAQEIRAKGFVLTAVRLAAKLSGGKLDLETLSAKYRDGEIATQATVDGSGTPLILSLNTDVKGLDYGALMADLGQQQVVKGAADAVVRLNGQGTTVRRLAAVLNGQVRLQTVGGKIESNALNIVSSDVLGALPFMNSKDDKTLKCAVVDFRITDGMANVHAFVAETGGVSVVGSGRVDLKTEALGLAFDPRAKKTSLLSVGMVPVAVSGTMAEPKVDINPTDLASGVAGGVARGVGAVMTFGLSALAESAFNRAKTVDSTPYCDQALAGKPVTASKGEASSSSQSGEPPAQKRQPPGTKTLESIGEGVGGALNKLFGN